MANFGTLNETEPNISVYRCFFHRIINSADHSGELDIPNSKNERRVV